MPFEDGPMIEVENLTHTYGSFLAVDNVSFNIQPGEIVGLLGHNGAGKTTIMKMMSGFLEPGKGLVRINELNLAHQRTAAQQCLGYLPEALPVYPEMLVADYLDYACNLKGITGNDARNEICRIATATDITEALLATIATLSRGYKQRIGVAQAIIGNPSVLILDEPTNSLDPTQTRHMRALIRELSNNATVILSTHIMQEVNALCDRVLIIRSGKLAMDSRLEDLRCSNRLILDTDMAFDSLQQSLVSLPPVRTLEKLDTEPSHSRFRIQLSSQENSRQIASTIAKMILDSGHQLFELFLEYRNLETVFHEINMEEVSEDAA